MTVHIRQINRLIAPAVLGAALLLAAAPAARAEDNVAAPVIQSLTAEGYTVTDVTRTLLGRILITSHNDQYLREVVLNRRTGAVIDDQLFKQEAAGDDSDRGATAGKDSGGGNGAGAGGGGGGGGAGGGGGGNGG